MTTRPLTEAEVRDIVDRYTRGQSIAYVSLGTGRSTATVRAILVRAGVKIRSSRGNRNWGWTGASS